MSGLFTINLQNVSARLMISMKFTKVKVNYEIGDTLRKQTTNSNKQNSLQKNYTCSGGHNFPRLYEPEGSLTCSHETFVDLYPEPAETGLQLTYLESFLISSSHLSLSLLNVLFPYFLTILF